MADYYDPDTGFPVLWLKPGESMLLDLDFGPRMRNGDTIASITSLDVSPVPPATGTVTKSGQAPSGTIVQARYSGGIEGEFYHVNGVCQTVGGDTVEADALLYVGAVWALDGSSGVGTDWL